MTIPTIARGLEGIVVDETRLSRVDGVRGELIVAGERIESLSGERAFEQVAAALLGRAPEVFACDLGQARAEVAPVLRVEAPPGCLARPEVMDALRGALASLDDARFAAPEHTIAAVGLTLAAWLRHRSDGADWQAPDASLGHAADLLRLAGQASAPPLARALDAYLVAVIDHGFNASTFAARVVTSTGSDAISAVVAAIGALKGPLHGGAPGPVLDMLDAIERPERARVWLEGEVASGRRIMGMGHRVYRVRDPRAAVLERALSRLGDGLESGRAARLALARAVEREAEAVLAAHKPERTLRANVEFYTAVLLEALGFPRAAFTGVFAAARVAGWLAHVAEQRAHGRLIRPKAHYIGAVLG